MMMLSQAVCRRRNLQRWVRGLSSAAPQPKQQGDKSSVPPSSSGPLPTRHSNKKLPLICTDTSVLKDVTQQILNAPVGSLFAYTSDQKSALHAWHTADLTVQKTEFVLRGHAHGLPNTQWNRWLPAASQQQQQDISEDQANETINTMQKLVDRLWEEGYTYMQLRSARLEEVEGPKVNAHEILRNPDSETQRLLHAKDVFETVQSSNMDSLSVEVAGEATTDSSESESSESDSDSDNEEPSYMEDFAFPGPTTHMYDTLLDAMACHTYCEDVTTRNAFLILEDIVMRHNLDGGDDANTLVYTRPTAQSFNASIRVAAESAFDRTDQSPANQKYRDESIHLAFAAFGALSDSTMIPRNSATYAHLIQVVGKYLPVSRSRGNISRGMLLHAREQGLVDESLLEAYRLANHPSNGAEFEDTLARFSGPVSELPHKWRASNRKYRSHPREAIY